MGPASSNDAAHIAVATVSNVDLVVSWNFKHIVHFEKIGGYEGVNLTARPRQPRDLLTPRGCDAMRPEKEFDCVEMKAEIQERLRREVAELGEDEARKRRAERLARDPIPERLPSGEEVTPAKGRRSTPPPRDLPGHPQVCSRPRCRSRAAISQT